MNIRLLHTQIESAALFKICECKVADLISVFLLFVKVGKIMEQ